MAMFYDQNSAQNFFYEKWITDTNFIEKRICQLFQHILASFSHFYFVTIDNIAITQERMKLLVWYF